MAKFAFAARSTDNAVVAGHLRMWHGGHFGNETNGQRLNPGYKSKGISTAQPGAGIHG